MAAASGWSRSSRKPSARKPVSGTAGLWLASHGSSAAAAAIAATTRSSAPAGLQVRGKPILTPRTAGPASRPRAPEPQSRARRCQAGPGIQPLPQPRPRSPHQRSPRLTGRYESSGLWRTKGLIYRPIIGCPDKNVNEQLPGGPAGRNRSWPASGFATTPSLGAVSQPQCRNLASHNPQPSPMLGSCTTIVIT